MGLVEALKEYPEVDPLTDLIVAEDEVGAEEMVRLVGRRMRAANEAQAAKRAKAAKPTEAAQPAEREPDADEVLAAVARQRQAVGPFARRGEKQYGPGDVFAALWRKQAPERAAAAEAERNREPVTEWGRYLARKAREAAEDA